MLGDRREVDIVFERHRHAEGLLEPLAQVEGSEPRQIGSGDSAVGGGNDRRQSDHGVLEQVTGNLGRAQQ